MTDRWKLLNKVKRIAPNSLEASARVPEDCVWFEGHFPEQPILPGIALLHSVYEAIAWDARDRGEALEIASLKRIRFTSPVFPGESFSLNLTRENSGEERLFSFQVSVKEKIICSGLVTAKKI